MKIRIEPVKAPAPKPAEGAAQATPRNGGGTSAPRPIVVGC